MTTTELSGRELDRAVAEAMGWQRVHTFGPTSLLGNRPSDGFVHLVPHYSAADCSGLAPVLAWLTEHWPSYAPGFKVETFGDGWTASINYYEGCGGSDPSPAEYEMSAEGSTMPEAACRLVIAWAEARNNIPRK